MISTVLVVDDDLSARTTMEMMLEPHGYQVAIARNGSEALSIAEHLHPDLILLDVMMPGMSGLDVCRRLRATPHLAEVPIIILTALDDRADFLAGIEAGADDFLTKPIDRQVLLARVRNITRLNRYRILLEQRENLQRMAVQVVAAQEQERRRISQELHDDLGQALTAHILNLRNLCDELPLEAGILAQRLEGLIAATHATLEKMRQMAQDLRPPMLDALGLQGALESLCHEFSRRTHLPVQLEIEPNLPPVPDLHTVVLYRVLQEALTNITRHANASQVWVELAIDENRLTLTVQDNGRGFDPAGARPGGLGLTGMEERLALAGGQLQIRSGPGKGTVLAASLPLDGAFSHQEAA